MEKTDFAAFRPYTLNCGGRLLEIDRPLVMGILNATPDSFYAGSRAESESAIARRTEEMLRQGADIIDVGGCSTRPNAPLCPAEEEMERVSRALAVVRRVVPDALVSIDTFRADIARRAVEEYGVQIVNDISGGDLDAEMFPTVARLGVPYVLTHAPQQTVSDDEDLMAGMLRYLAQRVTRLHEMGVADILIDPGFGFGKTLEGNYRLMNRLEDLSVMGLPLLVGVSRKSMIHRLLGCTPEEALNGTTVLHTLALMKGAAILRVHDVREAVETIRIVARSLTASAPDPFAPLPQR